MFKCKLAKINKSKTTLVPDLYRTEFVREVKLDYDAKSKKFYWLISQDVINSHEGWNHFNEVLIDAADIRGVTSQTGRVSIEF